MDTLIPSLSAVGRPKYLDRYISNSKGTNLADEEFSWFPNKQSPILSEMGIETIPEWVVSDHQGSLFRFHIYPIDSRWLPKKWKWRKKKKHK